MSTWCTVIRLLDVTNGNEQTIERTEDMDNDLVVKLASTQAVFMYDGKRAIGGCGQVDPIRKTITYHVELFPRD